MSNSTIPVIIVHKLELATPETLGQKIREVLLKNHKSSVFSLIIPERDPKPMMSRDPGTEI